MIKHKASSAYQNSFKHSPNLQSGIKASLIEKASQEVLYENLGYEEGKVYYLLLTKNEKKLRDEFSHSKKYRLLKNLFNLGCMGKIKPEDKEYFNYVLLLPPFLYSSSTDKEILLFLENEYLKNHFENFASEFSQLILKDEKNLIAFLLKYKMKEKAKLITSGFNLSFLGYEKDKVILIKKNESYKMLGVIDSTIGFEFTKVRSKESYDYVGYLASSYENNNRKDFILSIEKEITKIQSYTH